MTPDEIERIKRHRAKVLSEATPFWKLANGICDEYGVSIGEITGQTRGNNGVCAARDMLCYTAFQRGMSKSQIGRFIGRDPSSVRAACRRVDEALKSETPPV